MDEALSQLMWAARAAVVALVGLGLGRAFRRRPGLAAPFGAVGGAATVFAVSIPAFFLRPLPAPVDRELYRGVRYQRQVVDTPRRQILHRLTIDLAQPGVVVMVTPYEETIVDGETRSVRARTGTGFLEEFDQQIVINASYFFPVFSHGSIHYFPHVGDGVNTVGPTVADGKAFGIEDLAMRTLRFFDGRAEIGMGAGEAFQAVSGYPVLLDGQITAAARRPKPPDPRTGVGVSRDGKTLFVLVVDGRQPFYSLGATPEEVGALLHEVGAYDAVMLDGGGSSTLVSRDADGDPWVMNTPVHGRIPPGYQRPVASHIGLSGFSGLD